MDLTGGYSRERCLGQEKLVDELKVLGEKTGKNEEFLLVFVAWKVNPMKHESSDPAIKPPKPSKCRQIDHTLSVAIWGG